MALPPIRERPSIHCPRPVRVYDQRHNYAFSSTSRVTRYYCYQCRKQVPHRQVDRVSGLEGQYHFPHPQTTEYVRLWELLHPDE